MTYETLSMESFHRMDYSIGVKAESFEDPVDLSCKKVPSPSSPASSESDKDSSSSPLRGSTYLEHHEETNNNDSKSLSGYHHLHHHHHQAHKRHSADKDVEKLQQNQPHLYHHHHESTSFSSSNHERKSPYENRHYMMTPPSDTSSPKKPKFQPTFEHGSSIMGDGHPYPSYPILPMGLGVGVPVPVPTSMNMPSIIPGLMTPNSLSHSPITTSATTQEPVRTSTPVDDSKKAPRPFKAYPKDPLSMSMPDMMFDPDQKQAYCEFRNRMLESVKRTNEGTNIKMRRISKSPMLPTSALDDKDTAYWERRRKNNEAAKRSRDARRAKEDEIAIRAAFLEKEFLRLKYENSLLKEENSKLSKLVYGS